MLRTLLITLSVSLLINLSMFLIAYRYKTDKLTDISYALTFIALTVYSLATAPQMSAYTVVLASIICIWAIRLGAFLLLRIRRTGRDHRFDDMRDNFQKFGKFWLAQAVSVWVIMIPTIFALGHPDVPFGPISVLAMALWLAGLLIEAVADYQKYRFSTKPQNKGHWIAEGIWRYSRHPNYFGEIIVWTSVYLYALSSLNATESLIAIISPLFITVLLVFVSGIPILEKSADSRWGADPKYREYKRSTSVLVPWRQG